MRTEYILIKLDKIEVLHKLDKRITRTCVTKGRLPLNTHAGNKQTVKQIFTSFISHHYFIILVPAQVIKLYCHTPCIMYKLDNTPAGQKCPWRQTCQVLLLFSPVPQPHDFPGGQIRHSSATVRPALSPNVPGGQGN